MENKRLGGVLSVIRAAQAERDRSRLAAKSLTKREKERIAAARVEAGIAAAPLPEPPTEDRLGAVFSLRASTLSRRRGARMYHLNLKAVFHRKGSVQCIPRGGGHRLYHVG